MTLAEARKELAAHRMVLTRTDHGEFRVNFVGGKEATAYYATDLEDAVATGVLMRAQTITAAADRRSSR